jgi:hypothetical protein
MPGLSFQPWKAAKVGSGECRCTYPAGSQALHQSGRSPLFVAADAHPPAAQVWLDSSQAALSFNELLELVTKDGFGSVEEFFLFFLKQYSYPFEGVLIEWDKLIKPIAEPVEMGADRVQLVIAEVI